MSLPILLKSVFLVNVLHMNILPGNSLERFENIARPPIERRQYRGLKLDNGMKVMLISDELTETSAASLVVGVGAFNDPQNVPGLVNLLGHVLLTGGGENPSNFERFIEALHGVIMAPNTRETDQSFSFRVPYFHFATALREFAQILINPRLINDSSPSMLRKPVQAVQREFYENALDDNERIAEVEKRLSENAYFFNHLYCGNKNTLYEHVRNGDKKKSQDEENASLLKIVKDFFDLWYSSNLMTLTVLGRESLQHLENMVVCLFENIKNKNKVEVTYPHPWESEHLTRRLCIEPLNANMRTMSLTFPLPDFREYYDAAPENFVKYYLLYAGDNTLVSVLREKDLCTSVEFSYWSVASFAFAKLAFEVTELGMSKADEIINLTFQYIHMLRDDGVEEWMQKQMRMSYERAFKYHSSTYQNSLNYTLKVAHSLQENRAIENILREDFFRSEWNPYAIRLFLSCLRPNNMNVTLVTQVCRKFHRIHIQEQHYKTTFMIANIPDETIVKWNTKESHPLLELPAPNDLMPDTWQSFTRDDYEPWEPYIIHESSISEIWFMQENASNPEAFIRLELFSPLVSQGLAERVLWRLYYGMLKNFLNENVYIPKFEEREWVTYDVYLNDRGMQVKLFGANDKVHVLLEKVLPKMTTHFEEYISEEGFDVALKRYVELTRVEMRQNHSFQTEWCILQYTKYDDNWALDSALDINGKLQYANLKKFLRKLFRRIFIRGLVYGNYTKQKALDDIVSVIEKTFSSSQGLLLQEILRPRLIDLGNGSHNFYQTFNEKRDLYGSAYLFQLGSREPSRHEAVLSYLLHTITVESCQKFFTDESANLPLVKTTCLIIQMYPVRELLITVVSKETPHYIDSMLEKFLHNVIPSIIKDMPADDFLYYKYHLESFFKPASLQSIFEEYWKEIANRSYRFDRGQMEVDILRVVKKSDLLQFVKENLHKSSRQRRQLTLHILPEISKQRNRKLIAYVPAGATRIEDLFSFRTSAVLLPYEFKSSGIVV